MYDIQSNYLTKDSIETNQSTLIRFQIKKIEYVFLQNVYLNQYFLPVQIILDYDIYLYLLYFFYVYMCVYI